MSGRDEIDWTMSAALENVTRGGAEVPEVTSLEGAVRAWMELKDPLQTQASLTPERAVELAGETRATFSGQEIAALADLLPS